MKLKKLGVATAFAVSVSVVAACQLGAPTQTDGPASRQTGKATSPSGQTGGDALTQVPLRQKGDALIQGKVLDANGQPVAGALVIAGESATKTGADGSYSLKVDSGAAVNIKVIKDGFILRDSSLPIGSGETLAIDAQLVKADANVTRIVAAEGGKAVSSDGDVELVFPAGALKGDGNVRVTWLDPMAGESKPAAFTIMQVGDTGATGGTADPAATDASQTTPAEPAGPMVSTLNTTELPGPLETTAYGDRKYFSPVAFADVTMNQELKEGASATLRMAVSDEVLQDMLAQGDLKESDLGQELFPCFSWSSDESTWDKPALSKVVKDENGKYWFEYTVRANNMSGGGGAAGYQTLQVGDDLGEARVTLVVGGGRRVVDGTFTYGALIERSSDSAYNFKGIQATLQGGQDWTNSGGHYRAPGRSNLVRPNVPTTNYTGTTYAQTMGADPFSQWDRNGMFRLAFPPGERFEINSPTVFGLRAGDRAGTTERAAQAYLAADPTGQSSATQVQSIPATYVQPFYYHTDASVKVTMQSDVPVPDQAFTVKYTWRGEAKEATFSSASGALTVTGLARNAAGSQQSFTLTGLSGDKGWSKKIGSTPSVTLKPGQAGALTVEMEAVVPK